MKPSCRHCSPFWINLRNSLPNEWPKWGLLHWCHSTVCSLAHTQLSPVVPTVLFFLFFLVHSPPQDAHCLRRQVHPLPSSSGLLSLTSQGARPVTQQLSPSLGLSVVCPQCELHCVFVSVTEWDCAFSPSYVSCREMLWGHVNILVLPWWFSHKIIVFLKAAN